MEDPNAKACRPARHWHRHTTNRCCAASPTEKDSIDKRPKEQRRADLKASPCACNASSASRRDDCHRYESYRLAAAFGPRLLCRFGAQEARPEPRLREDRREAYLSDRCQGCLGAAQQKVGPQGGVGGMTRRSTDHETIEAEIDRIRSLGLDELRALWRTTLRSSPPPAFTNDLIARFICWHIQEPTYGGLDANTAKLLDGLARGDKPRADRRLKPGTVLVREYQGDRHTCLSYTSDAADD